VTTREDRSTFPHRAGGWAGFRNLLAKEGREWWGTRRWWVQSLLWLSILNGFVGLMLWVFPSLTQDGQPVLEGDPAVQAISALYSIGGPALGVAVVVLMQGAVLDELHAGTAAWILSKPVAREGFIAAKLVAHALGMLIIPIALPAAVAYLQLAFGGGTAVVLPRFLSGLGALVLHTLFYLALTMLLGVVFNSRGQVLGAALGFLLGGLILVDLLGPARYVTPWALPQLGTLLTLGEPMPAWGTATLVLNGLWIALFTVGSIWAFRRQDL
jgi:ABC-type transport system involved in multi-copper enzyme maturation permease subunit